MWEGQEGVEVQSAEGTTPKVLEQGLLLAHPRNTLQPSCQTRVKSSWKVWVLDECFSRSGQSFRMWGKNVFQGLPPC